MHFLFATYRWHHSLVGGAELHHRRLAQELVDLGHKVTVITTDGLQIKSFCHWGVSWETLSEKNEADFVEVHRLPLQRTPRMFAALGAKFLQARIEREERAVPAVMLRQMSSLTPKSEGVWAMTGWHHAEMVGAEVRRWTQTRATFLVKRINLRDSTVVLNGDLPKPQVMRMYQGEDLIAEEAFPKGFAQFRAKAKNDDPLFRVEFSRGWRPVRDFRTLCMQVNCVGSEVRGGINHYADLQEDYRSLGRLAPEMWQEFLLERCSNRPVKYSRVLDRLRGPFVRDWDRAIRAIGADIVIHCNLPWANVSHVRDGDLAMPLWHVEDDFYYWRHWIEALRRCRFVLANTPYTAERFYPKLGIPAHFVGPPIWEPTDPVSDRERTAFRQANGLTVDDVLVLTVCRKSGEKRYGAIADSVERLRKEGLPVRMLGIGPDVDQRPFHHDGCAWLGKMGDRELAVAYGACDVFALMSESESFGMVIPEAWHHGRSVVVNRACGPSASLVTDGQDGLLALPGAELDAALRCYATSAVLRCTHGAAGRDKALRLFVRGGAANRLLAVVG